MKKLFFAAFGAILFLTQCSPTIKYVPEQVNYYLADFREHSKNGFFITPEPPEGKYEPVGLLQIELSPKAVFKKEQVGTNREGTPVYYETWLVDNVNSQLALDSLVKVAQSLGANALTNYKSSVIMTRPINEGNSPYIPVVSISGFAVILENE